MTNSEVFVGLPDLQITATEKIGRIVRVSARYTGPITCAHCGSSRLRREDSYRRRVRHEGFGSRTCALALESHK